MAETAEKILEAVHDSTQRAFDERRTVMSYGEYLADVMNRPRVHLRNAAQYLADAVDHFGVEKVKLPTGEFKRYRLFDEDIAPRGRVVGQERVQENIIRQLMNFVRAGRTDRLILLHGPNGSAKTSIIQALSAAAERYSECLEGAMYRFNWVFPTQGARRGGLGFGHRPDEKKTSYAYTDSADIETRIPCELKDHPLFLLTRAQRDALLEEVKGKLDPGRSLAEVLRTGDLSNKNRSIFDALLTSYHGDVREVLRHIQVERFYLSRRYRRGVVAVEPQMSVDAYARQVTADRSLASLPPALQHLSLFETGGPLSDANRGVLEYNDLLKRPLETWKYLLVATEQAEASLDNVALFLDVMLLASSNDVHLDAFKEHPDWPSFKGRFELVTVPYLLRVDDEIAIYEDQIPRSLTGRHIAPHALEMAARWAVLTRLEAPDPENYPSAHRSLIASITPEEKLELYNTGKVPERLPQKQRRELRTLIQDLYEEYSDDVVYEGRFGASVREVRMALFNASQHPRFEHLDPQAVLEELRQLVREKSSYPFLRREAVRGYNDAAAFVDAVEAYYRRVLTVEVRTAMGLVEPGSHRDLFSRYLKHVSAWTKKEKLPDPVTGKLVPPDADMMKDVEDVLLADDEEADEFRRALISQIGAAKLERPDDEVDYELLFGPYMVRLEEDYYQKHKREVEKIAQSFLRILDDESKGMDKKEIEQAERLQTNLFALGYNAQSARVAVAYALKHW